MINIEAAVNGKFPKFTNRHNFIRKPTLSLLRMLVHEQEINQFLACNLDARGFEFIDRVFEYFDFSYRVNARERKNIPALGRLVIFANHPIGSLDGLAILALVGEVRRDVRIVANDMLTKFDALKDLIIPLDNINGGSPRRAYKEVLAALEREEVIIVFPAGEVSRARPAGVRDTTWRPGFLNFARRAQCPLLPIHIHAKNSFLFYGASMIYKPLGTALLAQEMFNKNSCVINFSVGEAIPPSSLESNNVHDRTLVKRLKRHLYKVGSKKRLHFKTERTIAHPEDRKAIQAELGNNELLGETRDGNKIYLLKYQTDSPVIREIGRLRETAFRKVGEGTGKKRDLDKYDQYYLHLVLWDAEMLEIAGAYRLGDGADIHEKYGVNGFYTHSLYNFQPEFSEYLKHGLELGRSFVHPNYWGKASLDYLWQGLGAYLAKRKDIRYLIGPISMSTDYSNELMDLLVQFYQKYHPCRQTLALAKQSYLLEQKKRNEFNSKFENLDRSQAFALMQSIFKQQGKKLPVLFKQYSALFDDGGFQSIEFSVDPDFGDCLDGLCIADLHYLKESKRKRYITKD